MKKILFYIFLFLSQGLLAQTFPEKPSSQRIVNDFVGVLGSEEINSLENKLVAFNDTTSSQIAIIIIKSVEPLDMNSYAVQIGRKWGVGQDGKNNGIVLLWATEDRKVYIATGQGLEGAIPDGIAYRIVNQTILPYFKQSRFFDGLDAGTDEIIKYASGEFDAEPKESEEIPFWMIILFIFIVIIVIRSIRKNGGGGMGNGRGYNSGWPYTTYTGWGNHSGSWGSGSGGSWSGGGGGGGFGGFGGGSFGGGGAGGSY